MGKISTIMKISKKMFGKTKKIPKVSLPKSTDEVSKTTKTASKSFSSIPTKKILTAGAVGGGAYLGYKAITGAGGAIDRTFNPPSNTGTPGLPDIPAVPQGWTPEDMGNFYKAINPQDSRVGGWEELGGGLGGAAESIPKAIGENIIPLAILAGVVILVSQRKGKHGK